MSKYNNKQKHIENNALAILKDDFKLWFEIFGNRELKRFINSKKCQSILVAAGGHGSEIDVLVGMFGIEIVDKIVYNDKYSFLCNQIKRKYPSITLVKGDFTELEFNMKFDVIVGNPPYQDINNKAKNFKLWHKFVELTTKLVEKDGYICFVTPSSVFNKTVGWSKRVFMNKVLPRFTLKEATVHSKNQYFDVGVETSHWIIKNTVDINNIGVSVPLLRDPIIDSIVNKVNSFVPKLILLNENADGVKDPSGQFELYYSGKIKQKVTTKPECNGKLKLVFPHSASYKLNQFVTTEATGVYNWVYYVNSKKQAKNIMSYTTSKLYCFYAANYLKTSGFTPAVKNSQLPQLDDSRTWTNEELYNHFGLTDDEINYIESHVK
jgi:site-specific DNA-methyltransferase (adenine-specific)